MYKSIFLLCGIALLSLLTFNNIPGIEASSPIAHIGSEPVSSDASYPHPVLSDLRVRKAIAHCTDRRALAQSVYPALTATQIDDLMMDSFLPSTHWAYSKPASQYLFNPAQGQALLDQAGWRLAEGAAYRTNSKGETLALKFTTTTAAFRQTWAAVLEQNLMDCGIQLIRLHVPASWWFGDTTGLARRDFELGAFAWVSESDPKGRTHYACDQIPLPSNNWQGQNYMGWCNQVASDAISRADTALIRDERIAAYRVFQEEFAKDMSSIPAFQRVEADAFSNKLEGIRTSPSEYASASAKDWKLSDGGDTVVIGFSQEPADMFTLIESSAVQRQAAQIGIGVVNTQFDYDYQPALQDPLSTVESGLAKNDVVEVKVGDMVYDASGAAVKLEKGVKIFDAAGNEIEYDGFSPLKMKQLTATYKFRHYTWSDGVAGSIDDFRLAYKVDCDRESGARSFETCDQIQKVDFGIGLEYTVVWLPGSRHSPYFLAPIGQYNGPYPSHQVLSRWPQTGGYSGEGMGDPARDRRETVELWPVYADRVEEGREHDVRGQPELSAGPTLKKIVIVIVPDANQAVAQLLSGEIDYLDKTTLGAGPELQTVLEAAAVGKVKAELSASPTWEHIDMNLSVVYNISMQKIWLSLIGR